MDDMILNDETYDKMLEEYDRQNVSKRALGGMPPFALRAPVEQVDTSPSLDTTVLPKTIDTYHHIYSIEYEIYMHLTSMPASSMIGRMICLKKRTLALLEDLLLRRAHEAPQARFLPEMEDVNYREGQLCSYLLSCELYDEENIPEHILLMSYLSVGMAILPS